MSKILQCLGWRKKKHKIYEDLPPHERNIYYEEPDINETNYNEYGNRKSKLYYTPRPDPTVKNDHVYSLSDDRKIRSYPASPVKPSSSGKRHLSDPKLERGLPIHNPAVIPVYVSRVPDNSPMRKSNGPFPFQIPDDPLPRRSSMFYGVKYDTDMFGGTEPKGAKCPAEKPIEEYYSIPSTSKENNLPQIYTDWDPIQKEARPVTGRRVTITTPNENSSLENNNLDYQEQETIRKTVVRFRPHSSGKFNPRESVKQMTLRAEHDPSSHRSYVRDIPLINSKEAPKLTTADGRPLVPLVKDKITRRSMLQQPRESIVEKNIQHMPRTSLRESMLHTQPHRESLTYDGLNQNERAAYAEHPRESSNRCSVAYVKAHRSSITRGPTDQPSSPMLEPQEIATPDKESIDHTEPEIPSRRSVERPRTSVLHESDRRKSHIERKWSSVESEDTEPRPDENFPFAQEEQNVYAVPVIPTRGRSRSILQQSVKSLISKNQHEAPAVHRKNIRYSMDTDVFSTNVRRRSVQQAPPGFVNMERGQPVLVSDVLNPITSLFVSDLKDSVPKDPLTRPKESNNWVKPRKVSEPPKPPMNRQRQSITKQRPGSRPPTIVVPVPSRYVTKPSRNYRPSRYEDSDSEDSFEMYRKMSKRSVQKRPRYQHDVYAANIPEVRFPVVESSKNPPFKKKGKPSTDFSSGKDFCGLSAELPTPHCSSTGVKNVFSNKQNDSDDEMDLLCYPSEKFLKNSVMAAESGSKLRWRIIIKRGEEQENKLT